MIVFFWQLSEIYFNLHCGDYYHLFLFLIQLYRKVWAHDVWHMSPGEFLLQARVIRVRISILVWLHWSQVDTLTTNHRGGLQLLQPIWGLPLVWQNRHNITTQSQTQPGTAERIVRIFKIVWLVTESLILFFIG